MELTEVLPVGVTQSLESSEDESSSSSSSTSCATKLWEAVGETVAEAAGEAAAAAVGETTGVLLLSFFPKTPNANSRTTVNIKTPMTAEAIQQVLLHRT